MSIGADPIGSYSIGSSSLDDVSSSPGIFQVPQRLFFVGADDRIKNVAGESRIFTATIGKG